MDHQLIEARIRSMAASDLIAHTNHRKTPTKKPGFFPLTAAQIRTCLIRGNLSRPPESDGCKGWKFVLEYYRESGGTVEVHTVSGVAPIFGNIVVTAGHGFVDYINLSIEVLDQESVRICLP